MDLWISGGCGMNSEKDVVGGSAVLSHTPCPGQEDGRQENWALCDISAVHPWGLGPNPGFSLTTTPLPDPLKSLGSLNVRAGGTPEIPSQPPGEHLKTPAYVPLAGLQKLKLTPGLCHTLCELVPRFLLL